jgi:hypothetical protein
MRTTQTKIRIPKWCGIACLTGLAVAVVAQSYLNDCYTVDGGGTGTGGVYAVSGTIGQPDAGPPLTNGQFSVVGREGAALVGKRTEQDGMAAHAQSHVGPVRLGIELEGKVHGGQRQQRLEAGLTNRESRPARAAVNAGVPVAGGRFPSGGCRPPARQR